MSNKYPYKLYESTFEKALEAELVTEEERISKKEWNTMLAEGQDYAMTMLEEDLRDHRLEEEDEEEPAITETEQHDCKMILVIKTKYIHRQAERQHVEKRRGIGNTRAIAHDSMDIYTARPHITDSREASGMCDAYRIACEMVEAEYGGEIPDTLYNEHGSRVSCTGAEGTFDKDEPENENRPGYSYVYESLKEDLYWSGMTDNARWTVQIIGV
jgi:hypothetical protein